MPGMDYTLILMAAMTFVGYMAHVLSELVKMIDRMPEKRITLGWMLVNRRYRMALSFLGAVAGFAILWHINDLSVLTAIGVGYLSSDVFTEIGRTTGRRLQ